jgi:plastocyanin
MALRARILAVPLVVVSLLVAGAVDASAQAGGGGERPTASFVFTPEAPTVGATVTFTSTSQPSPGASITEFAWDLDGVGKFDDFNGATATWSFSEPGAHTVRLRVRQENGKQAVATREVIVAAPAPPPPPPPAPSPGSPPPSGSSPLMLSPFPLVRIAGTVLPRGALVRILSVRAPLGARIRARCSGTGCPLASVARTSTTRVMRLRRFERRLPAGTRLGIFVRKGGTIGKFTRFVIRAGAPPRRLDLCLYPGRARPAPCP